MNIDFQGVIDIECANWDEFVLGGILDGNKYTDYDWTQETEYFEHLLSLEGTYAAHNGGKYDALHFLDYCLREKISAVPYMGGGRIVRLKVGNLELVDSCAILPFSLAKASSIAGKGRKKTETGLECICGLDCGGYCSIARSHTIVERIRPYLKNDCYVLRDICFNLQRFTIENDLDLKCTIGSSSWATAKRVCDIPKADWTNPRVADSTLYKFAREAYFGGRVQVFNPKPSKPIYRYDVNSAYPAALANLALPWGNRYESFGAKAEKAYREGREGIFRVIVNVPSDMFVPPLPVRTDNRISYPTGKIAGAWTGIELRYAESIGCKVERVLRALWWSESRVLFRGFLETIYQHRDKAKKEDNEGLALFLKWFSNSLTGKFAQRPERESYIMNPDSEEKSDEIEFCKGDWECQQGTLHSKGQGGCCKHRCTGACGRYSPVDPQQRIWTKIIYRLSDCAHVHFAAYLTSYQRIELHRMLTSGGKGGKDACYCDTDSVYSTRRRTHRIGGALGEWEFEGQGYRFIALAPKVYAYYDKRRGGKLHARAKGISDPARNWAAIVAREEVAEERGVLGFKSAARTDRLFQRRRISRRVHETGGWFGDRKLGKDNLTWPRTLSTLREKEE